MKKISLLNVFSTATLLISSLAHAEIDCSSLTSRTETLNGKSYTKYNVVDSAYMKCDQVQATRPVMNWKVTKASWSAQDESNYSAFIKKIGYSKCNTTDKCLSSDANLLRSEEDMYFTHYSDCADFPYYLRAYFAYKNKLPFAMVSSFQQAPFSETQQAQIAAERARILA